MDWGVSILWLPLFLTQWYYLHPCVVVGTDRIEGSNSRRSIFVYRSAPAAPRPAFLDNMATYQIAR